MGLEVSPPSADCSALHASPLGAETVQDETPVADQLTLVVLPDLTSEGTTRRSRTAPRGRLLVLLLFSLVFWLSFSLRLAVVASLQLNESVAQAEERPPSSWARTLTVLLPAMEYVLEALCVVPDET